MELRKLLHLAKNILISNFFELRFPYRLTYIVTYKCNFQCVMCNIWRKPVKEELSLIQIKDFFAKSNRFSWINLSGGEVFLRKDLLAIVKVIFDNCKRLYLLDFPTNGFHTELILGSVEKILRDHRFPRLMVTVSLDGPPHLHDNMRNQSGSWKNAVETFNRLRRLRSNRFNVFFGFTLQHLNIDSFNDAFQAVNREIQKVKYGDFHINLFQRSSHYYGNMDNPVPESNQELHSKLNPIFMSKKEYSFDPVKFIERRYRSLTSIYLRNNKTPIPCQALSASLFIDPFGDIYPCSIYDRKIGNIRDFDYNIYQLWDSPLRRKIKEEISRGECPHCWTPCEAYQSILANLLKGRH
jgi:MoaA/NifB/PqqE/SkfB family radical SAM enzyme